MFRRSGDERSGAARVTGRIRTLGESSSRRGTFPAGDGRPVRRVPQGGSMVRGRFTALAGLAALLIAPAFAVAQAEKPVDVTGEWERTVETPNGNFTSTMKLQKNGDVLSGVSVRPGGTESKLNDLKL